MIGLPGDRGQSREVRVPLPGQEFESKPGQLADAIDERHPLRRQRLCRGDGVSAKRKDCRLIERIHGGEHAGFPCERSSRTNDAGPNCAFSSNRSHHCRTSRLRQATSP